MAAAHMQRPYQPVYGTPQSNSPASVASSQSHDQHGRIYGQPPQQLAQGMYAYSQYPPMNQVHPSAYAQHSAQPQSQHPNINSQHLLMSHQGQAPLQHQPQTPTSAMTNSPRPKIERPSDIITLQRPPSGPASSQPQHTDGPAEQWKCSSSESTGISWGQRKCGARAYSCNNASCCPSR